MNAKLVVAGGKGNVCSPKMGFLGRQSIVSWPTRFWNSGQLTGTIRFSLVRVSVHLPSCLVGAVQWTMDALSKRFIFVLGRDIDQRPSTKFMVLDNLSTQGSSRNRGHLVQPGHDVQLKTMGTDTSKEKKGLPGLHQRITCPVHLLVSSAPF